MREEERKRRMRKKRTRVRMDDIIISFASQRDARKFIFNLLFIINVIDSIEIFTFAG